jgi:hypothetical protein
MVDVTIYRLILILLLGIDFTFSNQPITKKDSLHKIEENKLNYY